MFVKILADKLQSIRPELNENIFKITKQALLSMEEITISDFCDRPDNIELGLDQVNSRGSFQSEDYISRLKLQNSKDQVQKLSSFKIKSLSNFFTFEIKKKNYLQCTLVNPNLR